MDTCYAGESDNSSTCTAPLGLLRLDLLRLVGRILLLQMLSVFRVI